MTLNRLIGVALVASLLGEPSLALAGAGDFNVTVGWITASPQGGGAVPRIDKPQTGLGSFSPVPDTSSRLTPSSSIGNGNSWSNGNTLGTGSALGNGTSPGNSPGSSSSLGNGTTVPDQKNLVDPTTFSFSNSGTFAPTPVTPGQPASQFCSTNNVTVGENTQSDQHCSNTVNGTIRN